jgi:hypothetical protein
MGQVYSVVPAAASFFRLQAVKSSAGSISAIIMNNPFMADRF